MKQATANTFGALGYSSVLVQWFWTLFVVGMPLVTSDVVKQLFLPTSEVKNVAPTPIVNLPSSVELAIAVFAVVLTVAAIIYSLIAAPRAIGKSGHQITQRGTKVIMHNLPASKPLSRKQRRRLRERINWSIKLVLVLTPAFLLFVPPSPELGLSHGVTLVAGALPAAVSLVMFTIQLTLVKIWRIADKQVW